MQITIKEGNKEGEYFSPPRWKKLHEMAENLGSIQGSANFYVWYDPKHDFHHLEFDLDGGHYDIEYYKIFTCTKNGINRFSHTKSFHFYYL